MTALIGDNTCANCKFCRRGTQLNELVCHRWPPQPHPILGSGPGGQPVLMGRVGVQAPVQATGWCGEHVRKIEVANDPQG